jgi:hypothetical protein
MGHFQGHQQQIWDSLSSKIITTITTAYNILTGNYSDAQKRLFFKSSYVPANAE